MSTIHNPVSACYKYNTYIYTMCQLHSCIVTAIVFNEHVKFNVQNVEVVCFRVASSNTKGHPFL